MTAIFPAEKKNSFFEILSFLGDKPFSIEERSYINENLVIICGQKGIGKTTVCRLLEDKIAIRYLPQITTRSKRKDDREGKNMLSYDKDMFEFGIETGEFLIAYRMKTSLFTWKETAFSVKSFKNALKSGKKIVLNMCPEAAAGVVKVFPEAKVIVIVPGDHSFFLKKRTDITRHRQFRIQNAFGSFSPKVDLPLEQLFFVENKQGRPEKAADEIAALIIEQNQRSLG